METEFRSMAPQKSIMVAMAMGDPGSLSMECEIGQWSLETAIRDIVSGEPGVTVVDIASRLSVDKRTVLGRIRGGELGMVIKEGGAGRGKSHRVFLSEGE
jgi:hypothetical protein